MHGCVYFITRAGKWSHAEDSAPAVEVVAACAVRHMAMRAQQRQQVAHLRLHPEYAQQPGALCLHSNSEFDTTHA